MKKILSIILILCLSVSLLSACGNKDTASDIDTNSQISAVEDVKINSEKVQIDAAAFDEGVILKAEEYTNAKIEELFSKTEKTNVYELTAKLNDKIVQPNGNVVVTFPIPNEYDEALHSIAVFYIDDNYNAELLESQIKENIVEVSLSHFSLYSVSIIDKSIIESVISGIVGKTDKTESSETNSAITQSNNKNPSSTTNSTSQTTSNSDAEAKAKAEAEAKKKAEAEAKKKAEEEAKRKAEEEAKKKAEEEAKAQAERDAKNPLKSLKYNVWYTYIYNVSSDGNQLSARRYRFWQEPMFEEYGAIGVEQVDYTYTYNGPVSNPSEYENLWYNGKCYSADLNSGGMGAGGMAISETCIGDKYEVLELTLDGNLVIVSTSTPNDPAEKIGAIYEREKVQ